MTLAGQQLGHYRLVRLIGQGGMGEVYLAEDTRISRQVAIKVIRSDPESQALQQAERLFLREIKAIAQLNHPHILSLYDFGERLDTNGSTIYMVMPYCAEGSLKDWLVKQGPVLLDRQDIERMIAQAASALQHAHDRNIIHRDVKPANFLVRANADHPTYPDLLLTDFGIAKITSTTSTLSRSIRGTYAYMAPEQWSNNVAVATDQYALAMMTYQLLTGQLPFQGQSDQIMFQHLTIMPKLPSQINASLSPAVDQVILRALAKQANERFPTIRDFAVALQQAIGYADMRVPLTITVEEALQGGSRTITLPDKQQMTVVIPPHAQNGQMLRLPNHGMPYYNGGPRGCLLLTISTVQTNSFPPPVKIDGQDMSTVIDSGDRWVRQRSFTEPVSDKWQPPISDANILPVVPPLAPGMRLPSNQPSGTMRSNPVIYLRNKPLGQRIALLVTAALLLIIISSVMITMLDKNTTVPSSADATATAQVQATATTIAENPDPYPPAGTLAFVDSLSGPNYWQKQLLDQNSFGGACQFVDGAYQITQSTKNRSYPCDENTWYDNFAFEVKMTINRGGDCGGMVIRDVIRGSSTTTTDGNFYSFMVCQSGTYFLSKWVSGKPEELKKEQCHQKGPDNKVKLDDQNTIAVVANDGNFDLYVNSQEITSCSDSSYGGGYVGLLAYAENSVTTVTYRDARLWKIDKNKA